VSSSPDHDPGCISGPPAARLAAGAGADIALYVAVGDGESSPCCSARANIDATEHQDGLMLGPDRNRVDRQAGRPFVGRRRVRHVLDVRRAARALFARALEQPSTAAVLTREPRCSARSSRWTLLSLFAIVLLAARQFSRSQWSRNKSESEGQACRLAVFHSILVLDQPGSWCRSHWPACSRFSRSGQVRQRNMFRAGPLPLAAHSDLFHDRGVRRRPFRQRPRWSSWNRFAARHHGIETTFLMPLVLQRREEADHRA